MTAYDVYHWQSSAMTLWWLQLCIGCRPPAKPPQRRLKQKTPSNAAPPSLAAHDPGHVTDHDDDDDDIDEGAVSNSDDSIFGDCMTGAAKEKPFCHRLFCTLGYEM